MSTKAARKEANRRLAEDLRALGVVPTGAAWEAAQHGERDPELLRALNARDGVAAKRLPDGATLPGGIRAGDFLPGYGARAVGGALVDPDTGRVLVALEDGRDLDLAPGDPVEIRRERHAPAWVQAAAEDYRHARHAWEQGKESARPAPSTVPGLSGSGVAMYQLEPGDYAAHVPAPRFADFLREHAERNRAPQEVTA